MLRKNKERRSANISLIIMFMGLLAIFVPCLAGVDMVELGYALAFIGTVVSITAFITFLMFNGRAGVLKRMFSSENVLAHWEYSPAVWEKIIKEDMESSGALKIMGLVLGGVFVLIGFVFLVADPDENRLFLFIMLGIGAFFMIIGFISAAADKRRLKSALPEAIIAREGVLFKNTLYTWNKPAFAYLESVCIHPDYKEILLFVIRQLHGNKVKPIHYDRIQVHIPIPQGQEQSAVNIIEFFNLPAVEEILQSVKDQE